MNTPPILSPLRSPSYAALTAALLLWPGRGHAAELERHPYLQSATNTSIVVVWTTEQDSSGAVEVGPSPDQLTTVVPSAGVGKQHEVLLTGLTPDTRYYYRVIGDDAPLAGGDQAHTFLTSPPPGTPTKFRAWIVGDSGKGNDKQLQVRDAMLAHVGRSQPHIYLHMGDMAYDDGKYDEFTDNFYAPYADILRNTPVWPTLGNHEGASSDSGSESGPYYDGYVLPTAGEAGGLASGTEAYYSFDYANVHFVVLDSHDSNRAPDGPMLTWLQDDLLATEQEWIIAYWHHPPYTKGSHDSDSESKLIDMRENALPILEAGGVDLVLGGHSHIYERSFLLDGAYDTPSQAGVGVLDDLDGSPLGDGPYQKPPGLTGHQGAVYVVAGHGGTGVSQDDEHPLMYFAEAKNGSCVLDIQGNRLSLVNIRYDGEVTDRVAIIKGDGMIVTSPDGGEALEAGQSREIRWTTVGNVPKVELELSVDDGATWTVIEDSIPNTGSYTWTVPAANTEHALVRVSDPEVPARSDESNATFEISSTVTLTPVDFGHVWRYHDQGEDLGEAWHAADYDDSQWSEGPGQLGYGEGDEATELLDADPNHPSAYFRTEIELPEGEMLDAELTARFDDGIAVWINGKEVLAVNVDDGTDHGAWASAETEDDEPVTTPVDLGALHSGHNVITAMVKQSDEASDDLSFDLKLVATVQLEPPPPPPGGGSDGGDDDGGSAGSGGGPDDGGGLDGTTSLGGSGSALPPTVGADDERASGCGCVTRGRTRGSAGWLLGGLPLLVLLGRRRRALAHR
ncbi:metallophosphoesterase [Paraliomyxa miuraensis]|uniref:metallophosphoesterase n=1 Tax=Paraliomyxa miuraensis TaxID=376150 RepID=UPI0022529E78|nr:metallophosphoesterase [Paraliomyxa miuraensis]MCX4244945.1 metallophosphoesterase [Paraliomyxa miuraensis]